MDIFKFRDSLISDYSSYIKSFFCIRSVSIKEYVHQKLHDGFLWPDPLVQLNPSFESGATIDELVQSRILHEECAKIFRIKKHPNDIGKTLHLYKHQEDAIRAAQSKRNYVLTTGTGSGKSLAYIIPIVDYILRNRALSGIKATVVYPMNALANSQYLELEKFINYGYPDSKGPVKFARYTGQESNEEKNLIISNPPDILLTNYVMLELILTRPEEINLIQAGQGLRFLVLDELHTYRGRQGADVAFLIRRARNQFKAENLQCIGTSATLSTTGSFEDQQVEIATMASLLFGTDVNKENIIGETLTRITPNKNIHDHEFVRMLVSDIQNNNYSPPVAYNAFRNEPLSIWIESTFGLITEKESGRLLRKKPSSIAHASEELSLLTGSNTEKCRIKIQNHLLASYRCEPQPATGFPIFAFRFHQFISRGDTIYASIENESSRYITLEKQHYVPDDRNRVILPLAFCRECGQEYYTVRKVDDEETGNIHFIARELSDQLSDAEGLSGFLYYSTENPFPEEYKQVLERIPDEWIEEHNGVYRIKKSRREYLPQQVLVQSDGTAGQSGIICHFVTSPFRFCLNCGVSYDFRQKTDFPKLSILTSEGRSTATTILALSVIRNLKREHDIAQKAQKLLSFTDNRQDASLQAGHFNDFIEIGILRSAIYKAIADAGQEGIGHDELPQKVFDALNLPLESYATNPHVQFQALTETQKALRNVLAYRIYRDLKRGWRITSPNLEQCGLLEIKYISLEDLCNFQNIWSTCHPALATANPTIRIKVTKTLLDYMRKELVIKVDYLTNDFQERLLQQSNQRLIPPWALDENEEIEHAAVVFPRSRREHDYGGNVYLSARGGFGQYLRRSSTFNDYGQKISMEETDGIIRQLLETLYNTGLLDVVIEPSNDSEVPGYQVPASSLKWMVGDGSRLLPDPIRVPHESSVGRIPNTFFIDFYKHSSREILGFEAREHTAQVPYDIREQRERDFRKGSLPILFCSPTMELGIDISELNTVNMRNVPPTPANYAQRSGRAGRSGQPALVFTYCSTGSSHDQYFLKRPELMVSGEVLPPRLDLSNEDLVRSHIHALWLSETGKGLGKSLKDILDVTGDNPSLSLLDSVRESILKESIAPRTMVRAQSIIKVLSEELTNTDWYSDTWLEEVVAQTAHNFDVACERWRSLYRAALNQAKAQDLIIRDATRSSSDKKTAERLRREAEAQLKLLTESDSLFQSDFYSYRYFASEGFLPGYNFPRLPLSAYIPGRKQLKKNDEYLSRPRFLAISEFGPRAFVYHEGSKYIINKVILPVSDENVVISSIKQCTVCGYIHPLKSDLGPDLCEFCGTPLELPINLFRLQNVSTKRRDKINSDEEERMRLGFDLVTGIRFSEKDGHRLSRTAQVLKNQLELARIIYSNAANLWRINLGWKRRSNKNQYGFVLDMERGYWAKNDIIPEIDSEDSLSERKERVIPYVEDRKNSLLFQPSSNLPVEVLLSLEAALKNAIQVSYQLEDNELAAELLPNSLNPRLILFYESAEGGAGVLRRLIDDSQALKNVAHEALKICHFDPVTGEDLLKAPHATENCEAACYNCLMNYSNQRFHDQLDRKLIKDILLELASAEIKSSPTPDTRNVHLEKLMRLAGSELERQWLRFIDSEGYRLPSGAQIIVEACKTKPDFFYQDYQAAIYIDGPIHDYPDRKERDEALIECMEDAGITVIRFSHHDSWKDIVRNYPHIFGGSA